MHQLVLIFIVARKRQKNGIEVAARFTGFDHVGKERRERLPLEPHRLREGHPPLDAFIDGKV